MPYQGGNSVRDQLSCVIEKMLLRKKERKKTGHDKVFYSSGNSSNSEMDESFRLFLT